MRVENHTGHITKIPVMSQAASGGTAASAASVVLLPGVNEVDPGAWKECEKIALVKSLIELGERKGGLVVGDPKKSLKSLAEFSEKEAIAIAEETIDVGLLKGWKASEKREKVLEVVAAQLDLIDPKSDKPNSARI
jgi:hypothetical protein